MNKKSSILLIGFIIFLLSFGLFATFKRDETYYKNIYGNYQMIDTPCDGMSVGRLHLYIGVHQGEKHFFTIYDNAGTLYGPEISWVVGQIDEISIDHMSVSVDTGLFDEYSEQYGWTLTSGKLFLDYHIDNSVLTLTNNEQSICFKLQNLTVN